MTDQGPILTVEDRGSRAGRRIVWTAVCLVALAALSGGGWIADYLRRMVVNAVALETATSKPRSVPY